MSASATVPSTGEIIELDDHSPEHILISLHLCNQYLEAYEAVKKKLQIKARDIVDANGIFDHDGWRLRIYSTQRMNYDKAVLREVFDPDELDTFMEPAKGKVDAYIRDHLDELREASTRLRESMVPVGRPYTTVRIERRDREAA